MHSRGLLFLAIVSSLVAADWPQFRGPNGAGVSDSQPLPEHFQPGTETWRVGIPSGHSSPIVVNGRLFLTAFSDTHLMTLAFDVRTGHVLWQQQFARARKEHFDQRNNPASPSPAADSARLVVFFPEFGLLAYDHKGTELWRTPLGPFNNVYGMGASPILVESKVILVCDQSSDSFIAAFDLSNGKLLWKTPRPHAVSGHSTPSVYRSSQRTLVLAPASFRMDAYDVETGRSVWWVDRLPSEMKAIPVVAGDSVFVSGYNLAENEPGRQVEVPPFSQVISEKDRNQNRQLERDESPDEKTAKYFPFIDLNRDGRLDEREWNLYAAAFRAENSLQVFKLARNGDVAKPDLAWKFHRSIPQLPSVLVYRGLVYMISDNGVLTILEAATGKLRSQFRLNSESASFFASPVAGDGKVIFANANGSITVLRAAGDFGVLSKSDLGEAVSATPAIAAGLVFVRTSRHLIAFKSSSPGN